MRAINQSRVSPAALSVVLAVCSVIWLTGLCVWYLNSNSKDGWSTTPLFWMFILGVVPVVCLIGGIALFRQPSRLSGFQRLALVLAFIVAVPGGFFTLVVVNFLLKLL